MEKLYKPKNYGSTEPIEFDKYFKEYRAQCTINVDHSKDIFTQRMEILKNDFDLMLDLEDVKALDQLCSIDKLNVPTENEKLPLEHLPEGDNIPIIHPVNDRARLLHTAKCMEDFIEANNDVAAQLKFPRVVLQKNVRSPEKEPNYVKELNYVKDLQLDEGFICKVLVYVPFSTVAKTRITSEHVRVHLDLSVVHSTTLVELADSIKCATDAFATREVENLNINYEDFERNKEEYPSRCFFIENTFYNDMSHPNSLDYSQVVRNWALEQNIGNFRSVCMEGVTIGSLKFRLGYGYVYIHQGRCEHIVCFSDIRLLKQKDCLVSKMYPKTVAIKRTSTRYCFICKITDASWLILNSDRLPVRRAFFCTKCCQSYMFENGKKIGHFQLYPYHQEAVIRTLNCDGNSSDSE